ncbi:unnamed protein product [Gordionus sp. m RMFG-2023]|uniref:uncharacterized protein LOC135926419 n=1 Tax=Gordionus sp. m RMFG-2023 TaxID=3053472 RepID=UPI0030E397A2
MKLTHYSTAPDKTKLKQVVIPTFYHLSVPTPPATFQLNSNNGLLSRSNGNQIMAPRRFDHSIIRPINYHGHPPYSTRDNTKIYTVPTDVIPLSIHTMTNRLVNNNMTTSIASTTTPASQILNNPTLSSIRNANNSIFSPGGLFRGSAPTYYSPAKLERRWYDSYRRAMSSTQDLRKGWIDKRKLSISNWTILLVGFGFMNFILAITFGMFGELRDNTNNINVHHKIAITFASTGTLQMILGIFLFLRYIPKTSCFCFEYLLKKLCFSSNSGRFEFNSNHRNTHPVQRNNFHPSSPPPSYSTVMRQNHLYPDRKLLPYLNNSPAYLIPPN